MEPPWSWSEVPTRHKSAEVRRKEMGGAEREWGNSEVVYSGRRESNLCIYLCMGINKTSNIKSTACCLENIKSPQLPSL